MPLVKQQKSAEGSIFLRLDYNLTMMAYYFLLGTIIRNTYAERISIGRKTNENIN